MLITTFFAILSFSGAMVSTIHFDQQKKENARQEKIKNKKFLSAADEFKKKYVEVGSDIEDIGSSEYDAWGDKIDNSDDDFNVDVAVADIVSDNIDDISNVNEGTNYLKKRLNIMSLNDTGKYDLKGYKTAYDRINKSNKFISYPTGSYNDFSEKMNDLDDKMNDSYDWMNE